MAVKKWCCIQYDAMIKFQLIYENGRSIKNHFISIFLHTFNYFDNRESDNGYQVVYHMLR